MSAGVALVTGAGGFIGRWSVPALLARGYEVHVIAGRTPQPEAPAALRGAQVHWTDLFDPVAVQRLVRDVAPTHLLHFAWIATPGVYWSSPENYRWVAASEWLLTCFREVGGRRAVMAGTCAEYDWTRVAVCHETGSPLAGSLGDPITPYAECKLALQRALARSATEHGISTAWGRIFFQFGPGESAGRLVASVTCALLAGRAAECTHGRQIRSFLHVADVGAAFAALLASGVEGPVNVGAGESVALADLLELLALRIGRPDLLKLGARPAPVEPAILVPDVARLAQEVGWRPAFTLGAALDDTVGWWRSRLAGETGGAG